MMKSLPKYKLIDFIKMKLKSDDDWAIRGLKIVYDGQTVDERSYEVTKIANGVGFSPFHAEFLTGLAKQYMNRSWLSRKQMSLLHRFISKYSRQVYEAIDKSELNDAYNNYYSVHKKFEVDTQLLLGI